MCARERGIERERTRASEREGEREKEGERDKVVEQARCALDQRGNHRDLGFGFRVSGFGSRVLGFRSRVSGSGFRVSGVGFTSAEMSATRWTAPIFARAQSVSATFPGVNSPMRDVPGLPSDLHIRAITSKDRRACRLRSPG